MFWTGYVAGAASMLVLLVGFAMFSRWYMQRTTTKLIESLNDETPP